MRRRDWFAVIGYKPHDKQWLYHNSQARFRIATCGRRFGKSLMVGRDATTKLFERGKRVWIVGPTYDLGEKEFRVIWNDLIITKEFGKDKRVKKAYNKQQGNMFIEFPWQTRLEVRTANDPDNLVGESLYHVILSEAAKHKKETWVRYIQPALADQRGTADFATTPEGQNWIYDLWKNGQNPDITDHESWRFPSWFNTVVYPLGENDPEIIRLRRDMDSEEFEQEIAADFTSFSGKIYPDFTYETHVQHVYYDPNLPNYIAFDFGYTDPLAAIEYQITPMDEVRIWREHFGSHRTVDEHLAIMRSREQPPNYKVDMCFGDAADPAAIKDINMKFAPCVGDPAAKENWREGIDLVNSFVKFRPTGEVIDEYGTPGPDKPGLIVDFSCENTIREFNNYKSRDKTKRATSPKELPYHIDDHSMDALRYGLMHLYRVGIAGSLSETMPELEPAELLINSDIGLPPDFDDSPSPLWSPTGDGDGDFDSFYGNIESMVF